MLGSEDPVLCAGTLGGTPFAERATAASEAGFTGVSMYSTDYERARADGLSDLDLRSLLADLGLALAELDPLLSWVPGTGLGSGATGEGAAFFRATEEDYYEMADALGARSLNAVLFTDTDVPRDGIAEAFAALCDRAAEHGLLVHLEFLPWTQIPDLATALEIVSLADRPNGGLMLDSWHHFRSGAGPDALRAAPGERFLAVQLSDAPSEPAPDVVQETLHGRRLPGEGNIDLVGLIRTLDELGSRAPIGVEIFSDELAALPAKDAAQRAAQTVRAVLEQARRV